MIGSEVRIGREEGSVSLSADPYVSPQHMLITRHNGRFFVRDLESVNGVYLRLRGPEPLRHGDLVLMGLEVLRFELVSDAEKGLGPATERGTRVFGSPAVPRYARLSQRTVEGVTRDVYYLSRDETVIGRESGDVVFTSDPFMSRRHASISRDPAQRSLHPARPRFVERHLPRHPRRARARSRRSPPDRSAPLPARGGRGPADERRDSLTRGEIRIRLFGRTDVGQIREHNEDNFLVADLTRRSRGLLEADREQIVGDRGTVLGVCDGMGGAAAGEVASQLAVDIIYERLLAGRRRRPSATSSRAASSARSRTRASASSTRPGRSHAARHGHDRDHRGARRRRACSSRRSATAAPTSCAAIAWCRSPAISRS